MDRLSESNEADPAAAGSVPRIAADLRSGTLCLTPDGCPAAGEGGELGSAEKVTRGSLLSAVNSSDYVQYSAKMGRLGCMNSQPRLPLLAEKCSRSTNVQNGPTGIYALEK